MHIDKNGELRNGSPNSGKHLLGEVLSSLHGKAVLVDKISFVDGSIIATFCGKLVLFNDGSFYVDVEGTGTRYIGMNFQMYNEYKNLRSADFA